MRNISLNLTLDSFPNDNLEKFLKDNYFFHEYTLIGVKASFEGGEITDVNNKCYYDMSVMLKWNEPIPPDYLNKQAKYLEIKLLRSGSLNFSIDGWDMPQQINNIDIFSRCYGGLNVLKAEINGFAGRRILSVVAKKFEFVASYLE